MGGGVHITQCCPDLDFNLDVIHPPPSPGASEEEVWIHGGSMLLFLGRVGVYRKSAVCNFCSPRTDRLSTAVAETAVLKTYKRQIQRGND